jgi:hypothetical protein
MDATRKTAFLAGALFLITYLASIPPKIALYPPLLGHADYITGAGGDTPALWGAFLEVILIIANVGSAVVLFSVLKRQHEGLALAFVGARIVESAFIAVGILSILSLVTLRQDFGGADAAAYEPVAQALVAIHDWTFQLGPGFVVGVGNGLILGYLMYRSGLVPRRMAVLGLIGGTMICLSGTAVIFDLIQPDSPAQLIASVPEFLWELWFGIYLMVKGFKPSAITAEINAEAAQPVTSEQEAHS